MESNAAVTSLAALAHEARLSIYRHLVEAGPEGLTVGDIAAKLALPGATLSFHLSALKHAGLVRARREGRRLIQTADFRHMSALVGYLTENCCGGAGCIPACAPRALKTPKAQKTPKKRKAA